MLCSQSIEFILGTPGPRAGPPNNLEQFQHHIFTLLINERPGKVLILPCVCNWVKKVLKDKVLMTTIGHNIHIDNFEPHIGDNVRFL